MRGFDNEESRLFEHDLMGERDGFDAYETDAGLSMQWDCKTPFGFESRDALWTQGAPRTAVDPWLLDTTPLA